LMGWWAFGKCVVKTVAAVFTAASAQLSTTLPLHFATQPQSFY
jgi:hypothetical protein